MIFIKKNVAEFWVSLTKFIKQVTLNPKSISNKIIYLSHFFGNERSENSNNMTV